MKKYKYNKNQRILLFFLIVNFFLVLYSSIKNVYLHYNGADPVLFCDHLMVYGNIKYTLQGREVTDIVCTWPWTRVLGILVHGVFLDEEGSIVYSCILYMLIIGITISAVFRKIGICDKLDKLSLLFLMLSSWYYVYLLCAFNNGSLVCILLILTITLLDDHPYLAGIIMAFAMVKAQIAAPFMLVFLLRKRWKTAGASIGMVILSWVIYSLITNSTPVHQLMVLLTRTTDASTSDSFLRYGMFDFILLFDNSKSMIALFASIIVGLIILLVVEYMIITSQVQEEYTYLSYFGAAICSLLWFYTTKCDYLVLTIVALGAMEVWVKSEKNNRDLLIIMPILVCSLMNITNILAQILAKLGVIKADMAQPLEGRFDTILLLILLAYMCYLIKHTSWILKLNTD